MASPTNNWLSHSLVTSHALAWQTRYKSGQSHEYQLSPSLVASEGVVLEEYIGKYDFCHSDCHFIAFLEQAWWAEQFWYVNCAKTKLLIFNDKINI
jgi:hypothetical protein